jgi:PAS domain S-box-containing protein
MKIERKKEWVVASIFGVLLVALIIGFIHANTLNLSFSLSYLALIPIFSVLANLYLLISLARKKSNIKSIVWLCIFLVTMIFWSIADIAAFLAATPETGMIARYPIGIPAIIGALSLYIFIKDLTSDKDPNPRIGLKSFMFFVGLSYLTVHNFTNLFINKDLGSLIERSWGWEVTVGKLSFLYFLYAQIFLILGIVMLVRFYRTRKLSQEKRQAKIFLVGLVIPIVGTSVTNVLPSLLNLPFFIPIDSLYQTFMAIVLVYGLNKYQIFVLSPTQISENILETMSESVVVTNNELKVHYLNRSAMEMLNYDNQKAQGEAYIESFISEDDFFEIQRYITKKEVINNKKKFTGIEVIAKKTGVVTPVEISLSSLLGDDGKNVGYVFVFANILELQKAYSELSLQEKKVEKKVIERTEQLYAEHAKLEASISGLPIGFVMLDSALNIIEQNAKALELLSVRSKDRWHVLDALEELKLRDSFLKSAENKETLEINEIKSGKRLLHIIFSPVFKDKSNSIGSVILIEDITTQKIAERERNDFIVTASHEIRTPLSIIQGNLSNALDIRSAINKEAKPLIEKAYGASNQISALFNDILIVSDIENPSSPKPKYETSFSINDAIQEVADRLAEKAESKKLDLKLSLDKDIQIFADKDEVKESIYKLVDNAIKFTKTGNVRISSTNKTSSVVIYIKDTGEGISKEDQNRLFRKFVRLDNSLKRESGGTGLGLYIAKALAERNGGSLVLENSSNKGSTFSLTLPTVKK